MLTEEASKAGVDVAAPNAKHPQVWDKGIDWDRQGLSRHHHQVGKGQIDDKQVRLEKER